MKRDLEIGARFGRLTALLPLGGHAAKYICVCDCGETKAISAYGMLRGSATSCGCFRRELPSTTKRIHGMYGTREFKAWTEAKQRCHNPKNEKFKWYGARGISVCAEWMDDFAAFYAHIGPCPDDCELDRKDNDLGYQPGNVRWATRSQQVMNRRNTVRLRIDGEEITLLEYAQREGIAYGTAWARMKKHPHMIVGLPAMSRAGENNPFHKLTDAQVAEIRGSSEPTKTLSARYGVSYSLIQGIRSGKLRKAA